MARTVTIRMEGTSISAHVFHQKVGAFLEMLRAIDRNVTEDLAPDTEGEVSVKWIVGSIRKSSLILDLVGEPIADDAEPLIVDRVIASAGNGLASVMAPVQMRDMPPYFSFPVLEAVRDLVRPSNDGVTGIEVVTPQQRVVLGAQANPNLDRFFKPRFSYFGSVEGFLQMVSVAGPPRFSIRDQTGRSIRCTPGARIPEVVSCFNQRVTVIGRVRTNEFGDVLSVAMEKIEAFPPETSIPSIQQVTGKFDITHGKSMQEHRDTLWGLSDAS